MGLQLMMESLLLLSQYYSRIGDAVGMILRSGVHSFLAKTDIRSAICIIPILPLDYDLLGIC